MIIPDTHLILGGARSGKSRAALDLCADFRPRTYIATAEAGDEEMAERIARHQAERDPGWTIQEVPRELVPALATAAEAQGAVLVDCLTLWLANLMAAEDEVEEATDILVDALTDVPGRVVLVSNEVGLGLVPETPLGRRFRDAQGRLNQRVAAACQHVVFMAAGLKLTLKG